VEQVKDAESESSHRHPDLRARDLRVRHRALAGSRARGSCSPGADGHAKPGVDAGIPALRPATGLPRVVVAHAARS